MGGAADFYTVEQTRRPRLRRLVNQVAFWAMSLVSLGDASAVDAAPSENQVVIRDLTGKIVARVDETVGIGESMYQVISRDLEQMTATEFASEWGIDRSQ